MKPTLSRFLPIQGLFLLATISICVVANFSPDEDKCWLPTRGPTTTTTTQVPTTLWFRRPFRSRSMSKPTAHLSVRVTNEGERLFSSRRLRLDSLPSQFQ
uniref:Secreted protein n=1 Tax=Steinernema glaseri TaxID=37863 RepID=A0A1I7ZVR4_9BILA